MMSNPYSLHELTATTQPTPDVVMNKPLKDLIREQFEKRLDENLNDYVEGKLTASNHRVLNTRRAVIALYKTYAKQRAGYLFAQKVWNFH